MTSLDKSQLLFAIRNLAGLIRSAWRPSYLRTINLDRLEDMVKDIESVYVNDEVSV